MTPPLAKAQIQQIRVRLIRRHTLRQLARVTWIVAGPLFVLWVLTRFVL